MIRIVSVGSRKAEVIIEGRTTHLRFNGSEWADKWGTLVNVGRGSVGDWFLHYRGRMLEAIQSKAEDAGGWAIKMLHSLHKRGEFQDEPVNVDAVAN